MSKKKQASGNSSLKSASIKLSTNRFFLIASFVLIIITSGIYIKSLNNPFTEWDDDSYITTNADIRTLHGDSISITLKKTFTSYVMGNYHPLTMLSYCLEYNSFKANPKPYHTTNFILHLVNTLLVLCFIWILTQQQLVAFITALFFAIHPMHVESVAWVAERKDVLYSFFYLSALCTYLIFLQKEKQKIFYYAITLLLFVFAVLSKAMAVSLPLMLIAIDYYKDRKINTKTIIEKTPFLLIALIFGIIAIKAQQSVEALYDLGNYNFLDRILFSCYGIMMYLWKLILPIDLSCYYSYPNKQNGMYPVIYYLSPIIVTGITYIIYKSIGWGKEVLFGFAFFIISIALVLQILPVGGTVIAERYSYLPYVGIFFIAAKGINFLIETQEEYYKKYRNAVIATALLFTLFFSYQSFSRTIVWHDSLSLWNDAIEKDDTAPLPFKCRAVAYFNLKQYNNAITDLNKAIALQNNYAEAYSVRGQCYDALGNYIQSIQDYTSAIKSNPKYAIAYNNRGIANYNLRNFKEAINDYNRALQINNKFINAYNNRGNAYFNLQEYQNAINSYSQAIILNPYYAIAYNGRGLAYSYIGNVQEAINNYTTAINLNPKYAEAFLSRANIYYDTKNYNQAINDYTTAITCKPNLASAYYYRAGTYFTVQKFNEALKDVEIAQQLGFAVDPQFVQAIKANIK